MTRREFLAGTAMTPAMFAMTRNQDEAGFVPLFDGTSLSGWTVSEGPESAFYVDDGAIVVHSARQYEIFDFRG